LDLPLRTNVDTAGITDDAVTAAKIAANAVDSSEIAAGAVDNAHLADDAVDSDELASGAVDIAHLSASGTAGSGNFLRGDNSWQTAGLTGVTTGSGNVTITSGNLIVASGNGIDFSATADGTTMSSELFDDYEEGIYSPTVTCDGSGSYNLSTNTVLQYTKIGRKVSLSGRLSAGSESSPVGGLRMSLPFTAASLTADADTAIGHLNIAGGAGTIVGGYIRVNGGGANAPFEQLSDAGINTAIDKDDVDTVFEMFVSLTYIAA